MIILRTITLIFIFILSLNAQENNIGYDSANIIIDSQISIEEALANHHIPETIRQELVLVNVQYFSFDDNLHQGQLVVHSSVEQDIREIFEILKESKFPVEKVIPIVQYNWSDDASMSDNNTSSFNYRYVQGSKILSMHAKGLAIDINPKLNPYIKNNRISPEGAKYNPDVPGTIRSDSKVVEEFIKRGWSWGGNWKSLKDYQHFQKP